MVFLDLKGFKAMLVTWTPDLFNCGTLLISYMLYAIICEKNSSRWEALLVFFQQVSSSSLLRTGDLKVITSMIIPLCSFLYQVIPF